jgi:CheY-like chemotaxis protein
MSKSYGEVSILLVEDDDIDAMSVERGIKKLKLANPLYRAKNGLEALNLLRGESAIERPYIILLDLNMPIMGGLEFLHEIREDKDLKDSIIFVLTTSSADEDRISAYHEHVAGYIVKSDVKDGFEKVLNMLDLYWRVVLLPR